MALCACTSTADSARQHALDRLRESAEDLRAYGGDVLRGSASGDDALRRLRNDKPAVVDGAARDGAVTWDAVLVAKGSEGGGLDSADVILRACIRYAGRIGASPAVTWTGVDCPASIDGDRRFGPYDETVRLDPE